MPDVSLEQRLELIVLNYLSSMRAAFEPTLPSTLPFRTAFDPGDRVLPSVTVHCEGFESHGNRKMLRATVHVMLMVKHADTTNIVERTWAKQLRYILRDKDSWRTFIAAQSLDDRTGYQILRINVSAGAAVYDEADETREITTTLTMFVLSDELDLNPPT